MRVPFGVSLGDKIERRLMVGGVAFLCYRGQWRDERGSARNNLHHYHGR